MINEDMTENILLSRLENLEAQLRRLKQMGLIMILAICSAFLMGQDIVRQVIETRKIIVRHSNGKEGIVLETREDAALLTLHASDGTPRAHLTVNPLTSTLQLTPPKRSVSLQVSVGESRDGATKQVGEGGSVMIMKMGLDPDKLDKMKMLLYLAGSAIGSKQESSIYLYGKNGEQARMLADSQGQRLELLGNKTSAVLSGDEPSLKLTDADGYSTAIGQQDLVTERTGEKKKTSAASVVLFGQDRKVIWRTP
jgi:hypothetical protein